MPSPIQTHYPWIQTPLIISAPVRPFASAPLATSVSLAGGFGFLSYIPDATSTSPDGVTTTTGTTVDLIAAQELLKPLPRPISSPSLLPLGIGYLIHSAPLALAAQHVREHLPAAVWLFAPTSKPAANPDGTLAAWAEMVRRESAGQSRVWIQVGSVAGTLDAIKQAGADITLVVQGTDAGGHGLSVGAGLVPLLPEVADTLSAAGYGDIPLFAAGGIADARGAAAALALGAAGVVMGTRFLASKEVGVPAGFRASVIGAKDGGQATLRTDVFDRLRGTQLGGEDGRGWPEGYGARGIRNLSSREVLEEGVAFEMVKMRFDAAQQEGGEERFGAAGRDVTYVGTGVGLVNEVKPAGEIVKEVREGIQEVFKRMRESLEGI